MELDVWQKGLKLCIENITRLRDDGLILMENGSYGHAYFSFYTAMEEFWKAYFVPGQLNAVPRCWLLSGILSESLI